jgi:hypothetical protein
MLPPFFEKMWRISATVRFAVVGHRLDHHGDTVRA